MGIYHGSLSHALFTYFLPRQQALDIFSWGVVAAIFSA